MSASPGLDCAWSVSGSTPYDTNGLLRVWAWLFTFSCTVVTQQPALYSTGYYESFFLERACQWCDSRLTAICQPVWHRGNRWRQVERPTASGLSVLLCKRPLRGLNCGGFWHRPDSTVERLVADKCGAAGPVKAVSPRRPAFTGPAARPYSCHRV